MKKLVYLVAMLCMGSVGFAQSYDYDRISQEQQTAKPWFTISASEQEVALPSVASYGRLTLLEQEVNLGDVTLAFKQSGNIPASLQVMPTFNEGVDETFWQENPIQFFVEENGETVVEVNSEKEYTISYVIKMVWKDPQGKSHKKYIGKVY